MHQRLLPLSTDDVVAARFLRAKGGNAEAAAAMYRAMLVWRAAADNTRTNQLVVSLPMLTFQSVTRHCRRIWKSASESVLGTAYRSMVFAKRQMAIMSTQTGLNYI